MNDGGFARAAYYSFVTRWNVQAPLEKVWDAIYHSDRWPSWWNGVKKVEKIRPASGPHEVGSVRRFTWKSRLPYRLTFAMTVRRGRGTAGNGTLDLLVH